MPHVNNHSVRRKLILFMSLAVMGHFLSGCGTMFEGRGGSSQSRRPGPMVANSDHGRDSSPSTEKSTDDQVRAMMPVGGSQTPQKIAVVLGPGGFKAFAHAGVIKELVRARIPLQKVVGIEWGSLVAALFAQKNQVHDMEWKLYKLDRQEIPSRRFLSSKVEPLKPSVWRDYFRESFGRQDLEHLAISFSCPQQTLAGTELIWPSGDLSVAVEQCLAAPPLFESDSGRWSSLTAAPAVIEKLHREGFDFVILINVLGLGPVMGEKEIQDSSSNALLWAEARRASRLAGSRADFVIDVNTQNFGLLDFAHRRELVMMGEKAGAEAARRLAEKYGL